MTRKSDAEPGSGGTDSNLGDDGSNSSPPTDSGTNDGSGSSLSDYLNSGSSLLNSGLDIYGRVTGKPAKPAAKAPAASQSALTKYLPLALIGGGVLILLAIVLPSLRSSK